jgi:PelA/Pel-15E family pectate lyase
MFNESTVRITLRFAAASAILLAMALPTMGQTPVPATSPVIRPGSAVGRRIDGSGPRIISYVDEPDDWFLTPRGKSVCDNIVGWQNANGGWFKNYSAARPRPAVIADDMTSGPPGDDDSVWHKVSTFDNDATHSELKILARAYRVTKDPAYRDSFELGLKYVLESQYPNGGWPQRFPLQDNYGRYITFNDDAMTDNMTLLRDIVFKKPDYTWISEEERKACEAPFWRGIDCILKCQYRQDGVLTVWCQQHDPVTLEPRGGRAYELPSLTGEESVDVVELLMSLPEPDQHVRDSIDAAAAWFERSKITGKRVDTVDAPDMPRGRNRVMVDDPNAPPLWARFYDLKTNQPFVCSRDGIPRSSLDQISYERRMGYNWFGHWGTPLLREYAEWKGRYEGTTRP